MLPASWRCRFVATGDLVNRRVGVFRMLKETHNVVCISTIDWDFVWQGHQEIMSTFARNGHRVLFIENTGVRRPTLKDLPRLRKRLANWRGGARGIRQVMDNLYVYSPVVLPFPYSRVARLINRHIMIMTLRSWARMMHFESPIVWTWLPTALALDLIKALNGKLTVYYCFDNFEAISKGTRRIRRTERRLLRESDLVFATARHLFDYCSQYSRNVHLFPSGFSKKIFARGSFRLPDDLAKLPRPIVGYVGGIHKVVDLELVKQVALAQPHVSFAFVGPLQIDVSLVAGCPNVHFLGQKDHALLPDYIHHFDACMIPYVLNEYTKNVYPTKLNEYLILGKPVICTRIPELEYFNEINPGLIGLAGDADDFSRHIAAALGEEAEAVQARRKEVAERNSWEQKIESMTALIEAKLEEKNKLRDLSWRENLTTFYRVSMRRLVAAIASAAVAYLLLFHSPAIWWLGSPLRFVESPRQADVIVVLGGGIGESGEPGEAYQEKVKYGVQLYQLSLAPHLLFSSGVESVFKEAQIMKALAVSMGVPESAILLDERGGGNRASLLTAKHVMETRGWNRMMVVTSRYNTARSHLVAEKNLSSMTVTLTSAPHSAFFGEDGPVQWKHIRAILHEYEAIVYYWLKGYI